jgi:uncharacterized protein YfaS (alpha-2-macroglobulin family)/TolA-binding protein
MTLRRALALVLVSLLVLGSLRASAEPGAARKLALRLAEEPLRDRDWQAAAASLAAFRAKNQGTPEAREAWVLEADALLRAGRAREALDAATDFRNAHGKDAWAGRMGHIAAAALEKLGKLDGASRALHALVDDVTSVAARARIAALYAALADKDFEGVESKDDLGRTVRKRDPKRALEAYHRALAVGVEPAERRRILERCARILEELKRWPEAVKTWNQLLVEAGHAKRPDLNALPGDEGRRVRTWLIGRGRSQLHAGHRAEARADLKAAAAWKVRDPSLVDVLALLAEERFATGGDGPFEEGVAYLREAIRLGPGRPEPQWRLAEAQEQHGHSEQAAAEWLSFVQHHPKDARAPEASNRAAQALLRAGRYDDAIAQWRRFLANHPTHPLWKTVRADIVSAAFAKGKALEARGDLQGAIDAWRAFAEANQDDARAPQALLWAAQGMRTRKEDEAALAVLAGIAGRYARTSHAPAALLLAAVIREEDLGHLEEAIDAYEALVKQYPRSREASRARARLQRLRDKHLEIRMERVVGSSEAPVMKVETRNIESLDVRVYRLGLEEYFQRKGTLQGVENLQLEIVKPDWTSTWKIDGYQPHALIAADRPLPVKGLGAYVVVAGDADLTATCLFLVSDIECVVKKAEGRQLFVWAFDRATQAPVAGARVLASGVGEVGRTGKDGVWIGTGQGTHTRGVLVLSDAGAASTEIKAGPTTRAGFRSKAYVTTDRPVYRPGAKVSWRGIFLDAHGGAYEAPKQRKGEVRILDARGRQVLQADVTSSDFGAFDGSFVLDGMAPLGTWHVRLTVGKRGTWDGSFEVQEFRKPEFTVRVTPAKPVYLTGEKVEATLSLRYAFGGPVADAPVRYVVWRLPHTFTPSAAEDYAWYFRDERPRPAARADTRHAQRVAAGELRTDAHGKAQVAFETQEHDDDAEYVVRASAMDVTRRWITDEDRIPVTRSDHMAVVRTDRRVYRPQQEVIAHVRTMDAREHAVARSGQLVLLRLKRTLRPLPDAKRPGRGHVVSEEEVEVRSFQVSTDASGEAELRLRLEKPGRYRLRWRSQSRGQLVTAYADLEASGEAEDLSRDARLVPARTLYKEGESAEVLLSSPVAHGKALLTYEGEKVLDYRFVDLTPGGMLLELPLEGRHAPNVFFKVAIPAADRLVEARTEVVVLRHLDVSVSVTPQTALPGSEVAVHVRTTDASGKPVKAEVGLALVDETVYAVARDSAPPIRPYFYDHRRELAVVTASSLGTRTYGTTRQTSKDLLAEAAAREGDASRVAAASALRLAREALRRGDTDTAARQVLLAVKADPHSWDARAMLNALRLSPEGERSLGRLTAGEATDRLEEKENYAKDDAPSEDAKRPSLRRERRKSGRAAREPGHAGANFGPSDKAKPAAEMPAPQRGSGGAAGASTPSWGALRDAPGGAPAPSTPLAPVADARQAQGRMARLKNLAALHALGDLKDLHGNARANAVRLDELQSQLQGLYQAGAFAPLQVRRVFADTAAWEPHVVTGADGTAVVKVKLPDNLTTWRATARGVSDTALVGSGRGQVVAARNVLVRVDPPRFLTQGDQLTIPTAVHNNTDQDLELTVRVTAEGIDLDGSDQKLSLPPGGRAVSDRVFHATEPGEVKIEAAVGAGLVGDDVEVHLGTQARGLQEVDARSGLLDTRGADSGETFLDVPQGAVDGTKHLTVTLYPGLDDALLDVLLNLDLFPYGCVEQTVHRFLPALQAEAALQASGSLAADRIEALQRAAERGVQRLRNLQNPDGSFGWFRGAHGDLAMTAYALRGLAAARRAGLPGLDRAIDGAAAALRRLLKNGPEDARALGHLALAEIGVIDTQAYATTFRRRNDDLGVAGLAWMAMAAQRLGRGFDADELERLILQRRVEDGDTTSWKGRRGDCFTGDDREATALAVHALIAGHVATPHVERGLRWLAGHGGGGGTTKAMAAYVGAVAAYAQTARHHGFGGKVEVLLDGKVVRAVEVAAGRPLDLADRRFRVPQAESLSAGRHRLGFRLEGQGDLRWAARFESVVASQDLPADTHGVTLGRAYLRPEEAPLPGQPPRVKPGYTILRESARPKIEPEDLKVAGSGDRILVRLQVDAPRDLDYVLVEDPLPAGCEVLEGTAHGPFTWQERRDDRQVFFLAKLPRGKTTLEYVLQATHLGTFTALGTTAHAMYAPEVHGRAAGRTLRILPTQAAHAPEGERGPTPDEVYAQAKARFDARDWATARRLMTALRKEQPLRDEIVEEIESYLLRAAIAQKDAREIVRAREELVRRNPKRIPDDLDTARAIAFAYQSVGEPEVADGLDRDLVARGFRLETDWVRTLTERGREVEGLDRLGRVLRRFPVSNATADAAFQRARAYRELPRPKGHGGQAGRPMDEETVDALWDVTAHFAGTALAPAANYALIEALSRAGDLDGAASTAEAFLRRFPDSRYRDDALYFLADVRFRAFEKNPTDAAAARVREAAQPLVQEKFLDSRHHRTWSPFRQRAYHLLARVHHVRGELDAAIEDYKHAPDVEDAREALAFLTEEHLKLEETVTRPLAAGTTFPVRYRNVAEAHFKAYPVDLQVLFAVRKTLEGLHQIDLSGIVPAHQWSTRFADAGDHAEHVGEVALPVEGSEAGVWLVVAKAGRHETSCLVIKTDLQVVLQRLGRKVRVYVTSGAKRAPVRGAYVTVSDGKAIRARGLTDGRGVFEAPGVGSSPFVVVSSGDRYAIAH